MLKYTGANFGDLVGPIYKAAHSLNFAPDSIRDFI
nr:MAG TPA: hypothetical protein [Caudoviricetes sp.]